MKALYNATTYFISVLDCVYSNHMTDGIKVESRIIRYSQIGLLEKRRHIMYNKKIWYNESSQVPLSNAPESLEE